MRNLIQFFVKNSYFFTFLLLETLALFLFIQNSHYQKATFINSSSVVTGKIYETYTEVTDYFRLKQSNEELARENALLRSKLKDSYTNFSSETITVTDSAYKQQYTYLEAKTVNNSTNLENNFITLNRGSAQGVEKDMGVIGPQGIVGIVKETSANYCSVYSLLNSKTVVNAKLKKYGDSGFLKWLGDDYRFGTLTDIPSHLKLAKGDSVVTSAYSAIFPEGILIGTIEDFEIKPGNTFYTVRVRYAVDFKKLNFVYIVNNLFKGEQQSLEKGK